MIKRCALAVQLFTLEIFDINKAGTNKTNGPEDINEIHCKRGFT